MGDTCCSNANPRVVVACSGASNLGQIANAVAVKMQQQNIGQMTCLAALGAHVDAYIRAALEAELVVIDGCTVACAKKAVEHVGVSRYDYFDISKLLPALAKGKRYDQVEIESEKTLKIIMTQIQNDFCAK